MTWVFFLGVLEHQTMSFIIVQFFGKAPEGMSPLLYLFS
jgi:hypothetical protein